MIGGETSRTGSLFFLQGEKTVKQSAAAPGDVVAAGAPLVDLLIPSWGGAQTEYLAVRRTGCHGWR